MNLYVDIPYAWLWFCIAFAGVLVTSLIMSLQSIRFMTKGAVTRHFSIMELEFPASARDLANIINGIFRLPKEMAERSVRALRLHLYTDFLFMPAIYCSIFLLCMHISSKTFSIGHYAFAFFAWLQFLAWLFDIIENIYLLQKIGPASLPSTEGKHKLYRYMVLCKWGIALLGGICSLMVLCYFWLTGFYDVNNLPYLTIIIGEIIVFVMLSRFLKKRLLGQEPQMED